MKEDFKYLNEFINLINKGLKDIRNPILCKAAMICISNISSLDIENYTSMLLSELIEILSSNEVKQGLKPFAIATIGDIYLNTNLKDYTEEVLSMIFSASDAVSNLIDELSLKLKESILETLTSIHFSNSDPKYIPKIINIVKSFCEEKFNPTVNILKNSLFLIADLYTNFKILKESFIYDIIERLKMTRYANSIEWAENIFK